MPTEIIVANIPKELKARNQWVVWKYEEKDGKVTKVPYRADGVGRASTIDSNTWSSFDLAIKMTSYDGVGFVVTFPYVGIDIDHCRDPQTGELSEYAKTVIGALNSYTEVTPSNSGIRIWVRGKLIGERHKETKLGIEFYDSERFFTVTGNHLDGTPTTIEERQKELEKLHRETFPEAKTIKPGGNGNHPVSLADSELIEKAMNSKNGDAFRRLWQGDTSAYNGDDSSADLALCCHLAFWTGNDPGRIDRMFRQSRLYRAKWKRKDYRERTIVKAIESTAETHFPVMTPKNGQAQHVPEVFSEQIPKLPENAWYGLFGKYRDLMAPTTEAPDSYHFFSFCVALGALLQRKVQVYHARPQFPNFYICLIGQTGISRKDTAWSRARDILNRLHADDQSENPQFQILPGIGSAEGLLDALGGSDKVVILNESELLSLMGKARQEGLGNLIPKLTSLYDMPDVETLKTRQNSVKAERPFLSIVSGSTPAWLAKALTEKDILGGFANRFIFVPGEPKAPMPYPPKPDKDKLDSLLKEMNAIREWATQFGQGAGEIVVPDDAKTLFAQWYPEYHSRCRQNTLIAGMLPRLQTFIWKVALLYACQDCADEIAPDHLERAFLVGNFIEKSVKHIFTNFSQGRAREAESKILTYLHNTGGAVLRRDLYRNLSLSARELDETLTPLLKVGAIKKLPVKGKIAYEVI